MDDDQRRTTAPYLEADVEVVRTDRRHGPPMLTLRLTLDLGRLGPFDAEVPAAVVDERHRVVRVVGERIDVSDEQVVVTGRERADDGALERRDRVVEQRQTGRSGVPRRPAEVEPARLDRGAREAVGQRLLV